MKGGPESSKSVKRDFRGLQDVCINFKEPYVLSEVLSHVAQNYSC